MLHKRHVDSHTLFQEFIATTSRLVGPRKDRREESRTFTFRVMIDDRGCWCTNYGYQHLVQRDLHEGNDSVLAGQTYDLHQVILPREGDKIFHPKSGRTFIVGKVDGFVCYNAPLLENGVEVSTLHFEEYYKD